MNAAEAAVAEDAQNIAPPLYVCFGVAIVTIVKRVACFRPKNGLLKHHVSPQKFIMKYRSRFGRCAALSAGFLFVVFSSVRAAVVETWVHRYTGPADKEDYPTAVAFDPAGNVIVTGYSDNQSVPYQTFINRDIYTAKYAAANGALLWEQRRNSALNQRDEGSAVATDQSGDVVMAGYLQAGFGLIAKYAAADGALLWERSYSSRTNEFSRPTALVIAPGGDVIVTGYAVGRSPASGGTSDDCYTAKFAAADGALIWEKRTDFPDHEHPLDVALDSRGNVVITGYSYGPNSIPGGSSTKDYYTAKYAAADGALLWDRRYAAPANSVDEAVAVVVDGSNNVIVTGTSLNNSAGAAYDFYTAKYAGEDGAILWEKQFNASYDFARAMALDSSDNVLVTGISYTYTNSHTHSYVNRAYFYTAKYAAADGALLWEKRHDALGSSSLRVDAPYFPGPSAIAVDADDNVVITGASAANFFSYFADYYTAKYSGRNGALLWETTYSGTGVFLSDDVPTGMALGPGERIVVTGSSMGDFATVLYREVPPSVSIQMPPAGARLQLAGTAANVFQIERAPSVSGPWEIVASALSSSSGFIEYLDTNSPPGTAFYRIRKQ